MRKVALFFCFSLLQLFAYAQTAKYSNDFLNIGVGARWLAMGNTGVAACSGLEAAYWNPAGLEGMSKKYEVGGMHANYFAGMAGYNHLGFAHRPDTLSALAINIIRFGVDDIPNTIDLMDADGNFNYDRLKLFSVADYAFLLSYARRLPVEGLSVGGNAKIIYRNVGKFANAWGFGIDAAATYRLNDWLFGANIRDITTTLNIWSFNNDELEITVGDSTFNRAPDNSLEITLPQMSAGVARTFSLSDEVTLLAEFNGVFYFDGKRNTPIASRLASIEPRLGIELGYKNLLFVRGGVNNLQKIKEFDDKTALVIQPNIGLGIKFKGIAVDYALTNVGSVGLSRYSNFFSFRWSFSGIRKG